MKTPHKHADLIKAWADGAVIQWYDDHPREHRWKDCSKDVLDWSAPVQFRIKPEPTPDVTAYFKSGNISREMTSIGASVGVVNTTKTFANLCLTFDGETGKLKSAEVL